MRLKTEHKDFPAGRCRPGLVLTQASALALVSAAFLFLVSCSLQQAVYTPAPDTGIRPPFPAARFIVFSDPHVFAPDLGVDQPAFKSYIKQDPKMLAYSVEILESLSRGLAQEQADFIIICGDLTKDGEKVSHELVARYLQKLEATGKAVYVIPGNHDVLNQYASRYEGKNTLPVASVTPAEFTDLYQAFGYGEALYRDTASLSYIVEPVPGLWLFALDSCGYAPQSTARPTVTGGFYPAATILWLKEMLLKAQKAGKAVIGCQHHALLEHYPGQQKYYKEFVITGYQELSRLFASYQLSLVFTGHYHAQDAVVRRWQENYRQEKNRQTFLYDVMTGSLVNYPCPYRLVELLPEQQVRIKTKHVTSINAFPGRLLPYAYQFEYLSILRLVYQFLRKYHVDKQSAYNLARQLAKLALANFRGDEHLPAPLLTYRGISLWGQLAAWVRMDLFKGMSADPEPPDNDLTLDFFSKY